MSNIRPVYDIANCGPRHRFIANGRVVHNSDSLNLQNLPSGRVAGQSTAMRMAIEAPEDNVVLAADSSQIEVRVLAYEANQVDLLHNFANGVDPYSAMASRIYGVPAETILANHKAGNKEYTIMRQLGKAAVLGCGYGMGKARFFQSVKEGGLDIPQELADRAVDTYRTANASIVALWETCGDVLDRLIAGEEGHFGGPSGKLFTFGQRKLFNESIPGIMLPDGMWLLYRNLRIEYTEENGRSKKEYFFDRRKAGKPQAVRVYGPMLVENLTQALAFSLLKQQALLISKRYPVAFNVHDEFISVVPESEAEEAKAYMERCMRFTPQWLAGCPINCEAAYAKQYGAC